MWRKPSCAKVAGARSSPVLPVIARRRGSAASRPACLAQRVAHRLAASRVATLLVQRPREQVVGVDVLTRPQSPRESCATPLPRAVVIEQKEAPRAMVRAGLLQHGDVERVRVLLRLRAVADARRTRRSRCRASRDRASTAMRARRSDRVAATSAAAARCAPSPTAADSRPGALQARAIR